MARIKYISYLYLQKTWVTGHEGFTVKSKIPTANIWTNFVLVHSRLPRHFHGTFLWVRTLRMGVYCKLALLYCKVRMAVFSENQCLRTHVCPMYVANWYPKNKLCSNYFPNSWSSRSNFLQSTVKNAYNPEYYRNSEVVHGNNRHLMLKYSHRSDN